MSMAKFDIYVNPNKTASHLLHVDVQSDFVRLSTRWCIPLSRHLPPKPFIGRQQYLLDTPNLLAVPASLVRQQAGRLSSNEQLIAESCIEFMLRGY